MNHHNHNHHFTPTTTSTLLHDHHHQHHQNFSVVMDHHHHHHHNNFHPISSLLFDQPIVWPNYLHNNSNNNSNNNRNNNRTSSIELGITTNTSTTTLCIKEKDLLDENEVNNNHNHNHNNINIIYNSDSDEEDEEELGAMKEMMYRYAVMQPVDIDPSTILKPKRRNVRISNDPQSVAARHRRERISEKIRILQRLVPGGTKMDTASMLDEAIRYVKFLKKQIKQLQRPSSANQSVPPVTLTPGWPVSLVGQSSGDPREGKVVLSSREHFHNNHGIIFQHQGN